MARPPDDSRAPPAGGAFEETVVMSQEAIAEDGEPPARGPITLATPDAAADPSWPAFMAARAAAEPSAPEANPAAHASPEPRPQRFDETLDDHAPPDAPSAPRAPPEAPAEGAPRFDTTLDDHPSPAAPEPLDHDDDLDGDDVDSELRVPPTVVEGKRRRLWPIVAALFAALLTGAGLCVYFAIWSYQATAHRHVPDNANVVVRAEAARLLLFKPVRQHLWPLLLEPKDGKEGRRVARIEEETGVSIPADLREVVVASVDGTAWVALVGGNIARERFVGGLFTVLKEEAVPGWRKESGWLIHDSGATIGQAEDGTLILATHRQLAEACVAANDEEADLPVPTDGAIGFRVSHPAYKRLVALVPERVPGDALKRVQEISGSVTLSEEPRVDLRLTPTAGVAAASLAAELESLLAKLGLVLLLVPNPLYGAKDALSKARVGHVDGAVTMTAPWPYEPLDDAVRLLAKSLGGAKR